MEKEISNSIFDFAFKPTIQINAIIVATAVLHNICRLNNLVDIPPEVAIPPALEVPIPINADEANYTARAVLITSFFNRWYITSECRLKVTLPENCDRDLL